jgi:hypothetical protein
MAPPGEASDFLDFCQSVLKLSDKSMILIKDYFIKKLHKPISWFSTSRFARAVTVPGLIIHDEGDVEAPYRYASMINDVWTKSTLLATNGFGHNLKSPDVVKAVREYIEDEASEEMSIESSRKSTQRD